MRDTNTQETRAVQDVNASRAAAYRRRAALSGFGLLLAVGTGLNTIHVQAQATGGGTPTGNATQADAKQQPPATGGGANTATGQGGTNDANANGGRRRNRRRSGDPTLSIVPIPRQNPGTSSGQATGAGTPGQGANGANANGGQRRFGRGAGRGVPGGAPPGTPGATGTPGGAPPAGGGGRPAGSGFNSLTYSGTPFQFSFNGTDILQVLKLYAQLANVNVTTDQALTGKVTIIAPKPVTLDEAFKILQSVLSVNGYAALQDGNVLKIVPLDKAVGSTTTVETGTEDENGNPIPPRLDVRNGVVTQVIPLENVDAEALARELTPLVNKGASLIGSAGTNALILTDTTSNVERFIQLVQALDKTSNKTEMKVYQLKSAQATAIANTITDLFRQTTTRGRGAGAGGQQPGQPGFNPGQPGQPQQGGGGGRPAVVAVADTRTNSVIVVASPDNQEMIARNIINRLDDIQSNTLDTKTRKIKFADAQTVANLVNTVLSNESGSPAASQAPSFQQRTFGFDFFGGGGGQQQQQAVASTDPFGKVVADPRTNSVLITASSERMDKIDQLIDQLDVEVPAETTTFVIPLKNAQAADVAYTLAQAFGTNNQNGFGGFNSFFFGGGGNSRSGGGFLNNRPQIQRRLGQQNNSSPFGRGVRRGTIPPGPPPSPDSMEAQDPEQDGGSAMPQGIAGVMTPQGFIPTQSNANGGVDDGSDDKRTRQFFGFGGRQRALGQVNGPQYGRGSQGGYVNLLNLQNNVFVTPTPNGDGIIVTTTPDNIDTLRQIVEQLDVVPRQVMIEAIIAEVRLDNTQKFGFTLSGDFLRLFGENNAANAKIGLPPTGFTSSSGSSAVVDPNATGAQFVLRGVNYSALIQALDSNNKVKILSTPRVFTANNQQAEIDIVTEFPYVTGNQSTGFVNSIISNTVDVKPVGYVLNVTPRITRQGQVTIDLDQGASDLVQFQTIGTGVNAFQYPIVNTRNLNTEVTVQDGETVVVGGLIRDQSQLTVNKIPLLGDLPLLGQFFRSREKTLNKTELIIFLTPRVVTNVDEARALTRQQGERVIRQFEALPQEYPKLDLKNPPPPYGNGGNSTPNNGRGSNPRGGTGLNGTDRGTPFAAPQPLPANPSGTGNEPR